MGIGLSLTDAIKNKDINHEPTARHWFTRRDLLAKNTLDNERIN